MKKLSILTAFLSVSAFSVFSQIIDPTPPVTPVKLVMIHASIGRAWLCNGTNFGNLGGVLGQNNYYVSDLDKDFDAPQNSDIFFNDYATRGTSPGQIYNWFFDTTVQGNGQTKTLNILTSIYTANNTASYDPYVTYKRDYMNNPGGQNTIVLFKPTHVSSELKNDNSSSWSDLVGKDASNSAQTMSNVKELFNRMVIYFRAHPEKMFVLITPPPHGPAESGNADFSNAQYAANARTINNWLVNNWLQDVGHANKNVYVFDFFNVVTGPDNHHRISGAAPTYSIEHVTGAASSNFGYSGYYANQADPHPADGGAGIKATTEFVPLLNAYYHQYQTWRDGATKQGTNINSLPIKIASVEFGKNRAQAEIRYSLPAASTPATFYLEILSLTGTRAGYIEVDKNKNSVSLLSITSNATLSSGLYLVVLGIKNGPVLSTSTGFYFVARECRTKGLMP